MGEAGHRPLRDQRKLLNLDLHIILIARPRYHLIRRLFRRPSSRGPWEGRRNRPISRISVLAVRERVLEFVLVGEFDLVRAERFLEVIKLDLLRGGRPTASLARSPGDQHRQILPLRSLIPGQVPML